VSRRLVLALSSLLVVFFLCLLPIPASYAQEHKTFSPPVINRFSWRPSSYFRKKGPVENYDERTDNSIDVASNISSSLLGTESGYVEVWRLDNQGNRTRLLDNIPAKWVQPNDPSQAENYSYSENYVVFRKPAEPISLISIDNVEINGRESPFHTESKLSDVNLSFDVSLSPLGRDLKKCLRDLTLDYFYDNYYLNANLSLDLLTNIGDDLSILPINSTCGSIGRENVDVGLSLSNESASFTLSGSLKSINKGFSKLGGIFGSHSISWTVSSQTDWSSVTDTGLSENYEIVDGTLELLNTGWDLSNASYVQSISTQDSEPEGVSWKPDGTKLYEIGKGSTSIYEYDVSTPWDISTASFIQSISTQDVDPEGLFWKSDGTKLYEIGYGSGGDIYEYDVSTAWDISTASYTQSMDTQGDWPTGLFWKSDGTKLYNTNYGSDKIYEYDVSTAWDVSTASYTENINSQDSNVRGLFWKSDGTKLYEVGYQGNKIYESDVSTAWDISTASYTENIASQDANPTGMFWKDDGTKLYEIGQDSDLIYEYDVGQAYDNALWVQKSHQYSSAQIIDNITMTVDNLGGGLSVKVQTSNDNFSTVKGDTGWMSITTTGTVTKAIGDISGEYVRVKFDLTRGSTPQVSDYTITTNEPPNTPENLSPVGRIASTTSTSITADIVDPEGDNVNVHFWDNETGSLIDNVWVTSGSTASVTWSGLSEGQTYSYKVSAKDNYGTSSDNSYVESFTVNTPPNSPENLSPSGTIESSAVDISAVAVDNESDNVTVYFYDSSDDSLIGSAQVGSGENATVTWENLSSGNHSFYAKAGDSWDNSSLSTVRTFTVQLSDEPTISQVTINSGTIDRNMTTDYTDVYENLTATVRVSDNDGWGAIKRLGAWVRDNSDAVLVDNVRVAENTQVDSKTLDFSFKFDPPENADVGKYDLRFQSLDNADLADNYPYSPDFTVDDVEEVTISVGGYSDGTADISGHAELQSGRTLTLTKAKVVDSQEGEISIGASENDYSGTYGVSRGSHTVHVDVKASVSSYLDGSSAPFTFTYSAETGGGGVARPSGPCP